MLAFYTREGEHFLPTRMAISSWSPTQVSGPAICGLLARELETRAPGAEFVPARLTVDLFSPVGDEPTTVRSTLVREGKRICVADAELIQRDEVRSRATVVYLRTGEIPAGELWQPGRDLLVPDVPDESEAGAHPLFKSGDREWTRDFGATQNADRKAIWQNMLPVVAGESPTPFQRVAMAGDAASFMSNWGSAGIGYINSDVTLTLARLPIGPGIGVLAQDHVAAAGISVGTVSLYDRSGPLGTAVVTAVSNVRRQVDMRRF
ncbi:acyl-CoA thioesterase domain-containing protein [Nocardia carnea]|uniref:acyl-CoA thioesterase domain-containing protein n=1 Tax=Nocardia carnea TaxID=37328 RepID=UPI002455CD56|nr:acyl-CoA thioesterase domain-containing protein [Nocardia carnea]